MDNAECILIKIKPKVLIAESAGHYKIMEQLYHLLSRHCELEFYIVAPKKNSHLRMFPSRKKTLVMTENFRGIFFFLGLLMKAWRYQYINISTGPEGHHWTDIFNIIFFCLCCLFFREKIILTIRNIPPYLSEKTWLFSKIRNWSIKHVSRFTFETETMKTTFIEKIQPQSANVAVSYDRYPDTLLSICGQQPKDKMKKGVRIGLLGSVSKDRRNYDVVIDALSLVPKSKKKKIEFMVLGACPNGIKNCVIQKLKRLITVKNIKPVLSEKEFAFQGSSCDILLAPLSEKQQYGTLKGSGSIGDAVYLKKRLIIPKFVDPLKEFKAFCIYYTTASQLAKKLLMLLQAKKTKKTEIVFKKYNSNNVLKILLKDLNLKIKIQQ
jgi:hypothetical protein